MGFPLECFHSVRVAGGKSRAHIAWCASPFIVALLLVLLVLVSVLCVNRSSTAFPNSIQKEDDQEEEEALRTT